MSAVGFLGTSPLKFNINIDLTSHNWISIDASVPLSSVFSSCCCFEPDRHFGHREELMIVRLFKVSQFAIILK